MRKFIKYTHLILSLPVGIIISIICFTGAIMVFDEEIDRLFHPDRFYVSDQYVGKQPLPLAELTDKVNAQLDTIGVKSITVFSEADRTYVANLNKGKRNKAYVNPYTGEIIKLSMFSETFYFKVFSLHRWLMGGPSSIGKSIVAYSTILFLVISILGFALWFPKSKRQLVNRFKISFNKGFRRFFYDLHIVAGMYVFIFILLLGITGLTFAFPDFKKALASVFVGTTDTPESNKKGEGKKSDAQMTQGNMDKSLALLQANFGDYEYITIEPSKAVVHLTSAANERAHEAVSLKASNGELGKITPYADSDPSGKFGGWVYSLHVGSYWGLFSKALTFLATLIGGFLPITGYYMFIKRLLARRKSKK